MASSMLPTEPLWKLDQSNDCLFIVSEEYDSIKYAAYRTAMKIRQIQKNLNCKFKLRPKIKKKCSFVISYLPSYFTTYPIVDFSCLPKLTVRKWQAYSWFTLLFPAFLFAHFEKKETKQRKKHGCIMF